MENLTAAAKMFCSHDAIKNILRELCPVKGDNDLHGWFTAGMIEMGSLPCLTYTFTPKLPGQRPEFPVCPVLTEFALR